MRKSIILPSLCFVFLGVLSAQSKLDQDRKAIKEMCGCFEVTFNFAETFNYSQDSLYKPSENKVSKGLEWAQLVADADDKVVIQHILQVGNPMKPTIVKHWRQDWLFENTDLYLYNGDNSWSYDKKNTSEVTGQWTQKVFQVDDSPRYEGSATWVHDQDNAKVLRKAGAEDVVLAMEKGYNTYVRVPDERCKAASDWWVANNTKWANVRMVWDEVFKLHTDLTLKEKVDNKVLYKHLFDDEIVSKEDIAKVIKSFVVNKNRQETAKAK